MCTVRHHSILHLINLIIAFHIVILDYTLYTALIILVTVYMYMYMYSHVLLTIITVSTSLLGNETSLCTIGVFFYHNNCDV